MAQSGFACVPHVIKDMYITYAFTFTSGSVLKWYRDNFAYALKNEAAKAGINIYDLLIEKASNRFSGVFLLPHFAGAATPYMDMEAKGAIVGLNINTTEGDVIRAILEGITFEAMLNVESLYNAGINVEDIRAVGGMAKSERFLQLKADMMGKKITTLHISEAGTLGVTLLAGTAIGAYKSIDEAVKMLVKKKKEFYPDKNLHDFYKEKFETYKKIYPSLKSIFN